MKYWIILLLFTVPAFAEPTPTAFAPVTAPYAANVQNIENGFSVTVGNRTWHCYTDLTNRQGKQVGKIIELTTTKEKTYTRTYWVQPFSETTGDEPTDIVLAAYVNNTTAYAFNLTKGKVNITYALPE